MHMPAGGHDGTGCCRATSHHGGQMRTANIEKMYSKYYLENAFERKGLFKALSDTYSINDVLYAGSFIHITPSFFFPNVVYVDSDDKARSFFRNERDVTQYIIARKTYAADPEYRFIHADYTNALTLGIESFDLLISLYSGFVSPACKRYLKKGGLLLANNSHGDASMASIDDDFELVAVILKKNETYRLVTQGLQKYLNPKRGIPPTREHLLKTQRGIAYEFPANSYLFSKN